MPLKIQFKRGIYYFSQLSHSLRTCNFNLCFILFLNCRCKLFIGNFSLGLNEMLTGSHPAAKSERSDIKYCIKGRFASLSFQAGLYFVLSFSPRGHNAQLYYLIVFNKGAVICSLLSLTGNRNC